MALVESIKVALGTRMSAFQLKDPFGTSYDSKDLSGKKGLLIAFTCNHCPYAQAVWPRLIRLASYAKPLGVNTAGINPNISAEQVIIAGRSARPAPSETIL